MSVLEPIPEMPQPAPSTGLPPTDLPPTDLPPTDLPSLETILGWHRAGELAQAMRGYQAILAVEPDNSNALHLIGCLLRQRQQTEAALAYLTASVLCAPNQWSVFFNYANVLRADGQPERAAAAYYRAVQIAPEAAAAAYDPLVELCFSQAMAAHASQNLAQVKAWLRLALILRPDVAELHAELGLVCQLMAELDAAIAHFEWAMVLDPNLTHFENNYIAAMIRKGARAAAVRPFKERAGRIWSEVAVPGPRLPPAARREMTAGGRMALSRPRFWSAEDEDYFFTGCVKQWVPPEMPILSPYPPLVLTALQQAWCGGRHAVVGDAAGNLLLSLYPDDLWVQSRHELIADTRQGAEIRKAAVPVPEIAGPVFYACAAWHWNYYHYLTEAIPRLLLTRQMLPAAAQPKARFITPVDQPFQQQVLALLGIGPEQIIPADGQWRTLGQLVVLENFQNTMAVRPETVGCLQKILAPAAMPEGRPEPWRRLYISRADSTRKIVNEEAVLAQLVPLGFESVVCSAYSVAEQIRLFAEAAIVVGAHGANLTNTVFMAPDTVVVEMMDRGYTTQPYWVIASLSGLHYAILLCDSGDPGNRDSRNRDMQVPLEPLRQLLGPLLALLPERRGLS